MRKSLLKTIVATAIVGATFALSNVVAMAATDYAVGDLEGLSFEKNTVDNGDGTKTITSTWTFAPSDPADTENKTATEESDTVYKSGSKFYDIVGVKDVKISAGDTVAGIALTGSGTKSWNKSNYLAISNKMGFTIPVTEGVTSGTVTVTVSDTKEKRYLYLTENSEKTLPYNKSTAQTVEFAASEVSNGGLSFSNSKSDGDYKMKTLVLVETVGSSSTEEETFLAGVLDKKPAVAKVNGKYYAILPISENAADSKTSLTVAGEEAEYIYQNVSITGLNKSAAADFGGSYVYGIEVVPSASGATTEPTLAQVQDAVTVAFS